MKNVPNSLFITGMARSGTTLLDKILDTHEEVTVFSQPFPFLYRYVKKKFFEEINYPETYYVLNNLFKEEYYSQNEFLNFLKNFKIRKSDLKEILLEMEGWSGQQTKINEIESLISNFKDSCLNKTYKTLICNLNQKKDIKILGSKEILAEEFIPFFLSNNIKVILIIRDPRDVLTSINVGKGTDYTGDHRPTLFHLRNWRKSVAIANTFKEHENCLVLKYEDILINKEKMLRTITSFLNIPEFPSGCFDNGIKTKNGDYWKGNSSTKLYQGINQSNKEKYKRYLSNNTIGYIDYMCKPEMLAFSYPLEIMEFKPRNFREPFKIENCHLNPNMSTKDSELKAEYYRLELLNNTTAPKKEIVRMFYSTKNYNVLKSALI